MNRRRLDVARLQDGLVRVCGLLGIGVAGAAREVHQRAVSIELRLRGPLFDGRRPSVSRVVLDLSLKETPLTPDRLLLRSPYPDVPESALHVMSRPEMCAEKVRAVMTRDKSRDAYDL